MTAYTPHSESSVELTKVVVIVTGTWSNACTDGFRCNVARPSYASFGDSADSLPTVQPRYLLEERAEPRKNPFW